jgi:hypothetical protein
MNTGHNRSTDCRGTNSSRAVGTHWDQLVDFPIPVRNARRGDSSPRRPARPSHKGLESSQVTERQRLDSTEEWLVAEQAAAEEDWGYQPLPSLAEVARSIRDEVAGLVSALRFVFMNISAAVSRGAERDAVQFRGIHNW